MKKTKLGELLRVKHGYAFKKNNYVKKSNTVLVTLANISESNNFQYNEEKTTYYGAEFPEEFILKEGDLIMPLTEQSIGLFGNSAFVPKIEGIQFALNQRVGKVIPDNNKIDDYYLHFLLSTELVREQLEYRASGTQQRNISVDDIYDVTVFIPSLAMQKAIGQSLYNIEKKINNNNIINEILQKQMCLYYEKMMSDAEKGNINGDYTIASELSEVITGKEDANFAVESGPYNFFTCSKETLKCNRYAFDSSSVLIAGNGDFNVKHYSGKFNAYQRTYVLTPPQDYYGLLYLASLYRIKAFKTSSSGSIVKFITKNDIEEIPIFKPYKKQYLDTINRMVFLQEQCVKENEQLSSLLDWLLPLLMNGQALIED